MLGTIERIAQQLTIDGFVYRFDPLQTPGLDPLPLGDMEAAFLPCTFWLATAYAKAGLIDKAKLVLAGLEELFSDRPTLLAEGFDARNQVFLGNVPLLFSHVEYVRAKLELSLAEAKSVSLHKAA